jgi:transcriptional regulator with XRE-family HTH domain
MGRSFTVRVLRICIRKAAGLTQRDVAHRLDVPPSWVAKVETGERRIDLVEMCLFSSACEVDPTSVCSRLSAQIAVIQAKRHRKGKRPR